MPKKTERGDPLGFFNIHYVAKHQKNAGGDPLVSPGMVRYAEKQENLFWFSSLGQIVQFGAIIFCRTFKNYFGQLVWIEKKSHYNSRVSLHEAPTKNDTISEFGRDDNRKRNTRTPPSTAREKRFLSTGNWTTSIEMPKQ